MKVLVSIYFQPREGLIVIGAFSLIVKSLRMFVCSSNVQYIEQGTVEDFNIRKLQGKCELWENRRENSKLSTISTFHIIVSIVVGCYALLFATHQYFKMTELQMEVVWEFTSSIWCMQQCQCSTKLPVHCCACKIVFANQGLKCIKSLQQPVNPISVILNQLACDRNLNKSRLTLQPGCNYNLKVYISMSQSFLALIQKCTFLCLN